MCRQAVDTHGVTTFVMWSPLVRLLTINGGTACCPRSRDYNPVMSTSRPPKQQRWTTRQLLAWTMTFFDGKGIDHPRLSAEMLLGHVLGVARLKLYMDPDRPASDLERAAFRDLVERAADHEPVDYLVGQTPFFSMMLKVTPHVLIPRPSTETLYFPPTRSNLQATCFQSAET